MARSRELKVMVVGDATSAQRALNGLSKTGSTLGSKLKTLSRGFATAGAAIAAASGYAINAAADQEEAINKASVIFGKNRKAILRWSKTTADSLGIAREAALGAAGGFGNILETSGIAGKQLAPMSKSLVQLAADMASFNNEDPSEMLEKLRSGLVGEAEPLRQVGVLLSEARVAEEAYKSGIAKRGEALTDAQKVQARYNLILEDTSKQQGDFARTSDSLPNQLRRMRSSFSDLSAELGRKLLPFAVKVAEWANDTLPKAFKWLSNTGIPFVVWAWDAMVEGIGNGLAIITDMIASFIAFWTDAAGKILAVAAKAFGWIPGIGAKLRNARDDFNEWSDGIVAGLRDQADVFRTWGDDVAETLANARADWNGFKMAVEKGVLPPGAVWSWVPSDLPGKALGGPVQGRRPYMVGERGPELFVPRTSGRVVPNNRLASAGPSQVVNISVDFGGSVILGGNNRLAMDQLASKVQQAMRRRGVLMQG